MEKKTCSFCREEVIVQGYDSINQEDIGFCGCSIWVRGKSGLWIMVKELCRKTDEKFSKSEIR